MPSSNYFLTFFNFIWTHLLFLFQGWDVREVLALCIMVWRLEKESSLLRNRRRLDRLAASLVALHSVRWKFDSQSQRCHWGHIFYLSLRTRAKMIFFKSCEFLLIFSVFSGGMLVILAMCYLALWMGASTPNPDARLLAPHRDDSYDRWKQWNHKSYCDWNWSLAWSGFCFSRVNINVSQD